jgi:hypothetical protein
MACTNVSAGLPARECRAWLDLYDSTAGSGWTQCSDHRRDPCGCAKVTCVSPSNGMHGRLHVQQIELSGSRLFGSIPASIAQLDHLALLWLPHNHLTGSVPEAVGNLSASLTSLELSGNHLAGELPASFSGLSNLVYLGLSNNRFDGTFPASFNWSRFSGGGTCCPEGDCHCCTLAGGNLFDCPLPPPAIAGCGIIERDCRCRYQPTYSFHYY